MAILVKVPGSSLGKLFYLRFFFILNKKNRHEEHKGHAMIFMLTKSVKPPFLDRDDSIRQKPPSQFQKQTDRGRFVIPDGSDEGAILVRYGVNSYSSQFVLKSIRTHFGQFVLSFRSIRTHLIKFSQLVLILVDSYSVWSIRTPTKI